MDGILGLPPTPQRREARHLAAVMREVIADLVSTTADDATLAGAAEQLESVAQQLAAMPGGQAYAGFSEAANAGAALRAMAMGRDGDDPERFASFDHSPLIGLANPLAPPMVMTYDPADESILLGHVTFGAAYEGPPGFVHGGYVAAAFDELLGATQSLSGTQGMTAHIEIDYRNPTPLGVELTMRGHLERIDGRKIWARATLHSAEALCAEAEALFLSLVPGRFQQMLLDRGTQDRPRRNTNP